MVDEKKVKKEKVPKVVKEKVVKVPRGSVPKETIDAMNVAHQDWKTIPQVKYDRDGLRIS